MHQSPILAPVPTHARSLTFALAPGADPRRVLDRVADYTIDDSVVVGLGAPLVGDIVVGLRPMPALSATKVAIPSTQGALWSLLVGDDPGEILHRARALSASLGADVVLMEDVATFMFGGGRDLSGFEDGTENPKEEAAARAALISKEGKGRDEGSFVAVQRWAHDLGRLQSMSREAQEAIIGRDRETNVELEDAPASAHVKRAAQESFEPEAFMVRRSMPYGSVHENGLLFVAYGRSLDPFERVLTRMIGLEDGIVDGLFAFSRPVTGGYYFCPPRTGSRLDLSAARR